MNLIKLQMYDLTPFGCYYNMEEKVKWKVSGIISATITPNTNITVVEYELQKASEQKIIDFIKQCGHDCSSSNEYEEMKHDMHKMGGVKHKWHDMKAYITRDMRIIML